MEMLRKKSEEYVQLASPDFKYMNGETLTLEGEWD